MMHITSATKPSFSFVKDYPAQNQCTITFSDNIVDNGDGTWTYDQYTITEPWKINLQAQIEAYYSDWLQKAKDAEQEAEAAKIREYRDNLLSQCDLQHCNPEKWNAMSDAEKLAWAAYKQVLRDVPTQTGFPYSVTWPVLPADTTGVLADSLTANNLVGMQVTSLSLSDAEKSSLVDWLGKQVVQMQLDIAALKGGASQ